MNPPAPCFVDFFAGSGLGWERGLEIGGFDIGTCVPVWSNDICPKRAAIYRANYDDNLFCPDSIGQVSGP